MSEWIACKDKMPPEGQEVIAHFKETAEYAREESVTLTIYEPAKNPQFPWRVLMGRKADGVFDVWMPLPPPPSQEK